MAIKVGLSRLRVCDDLGSCLSTYFAKNAMKVLPISLVHTVDVTGLPKHHRDPFDRLLIAQALAEKVPIVSADPQFARYPMEVL